MVLFFNGQRRAVWSAVGPVVLAVSGLLAAPGPAAAANAVPTLVNANSYSLDVNYSKNPAALSAIQSGLGAPWSLGAVMDKANHDRASLSTCDGGVARSDGGTDVSKMAGKLGGFCFDAAETSAACTYPQGISTTRDATGSKYDGRQVVAVSWDRPTSCGAGDFKDMWITFVDWDSTQANKYVKVLLVLPTSTSDQYTTLIGKSGGLAWYGDYLYVADSHFNNASQAIHIFDMKKIFRVTTTGSAVGRQSDGTYLAGNYGFIMPEVGRLTAHAGSAGMTFSTMGLDNSTSAPSIVTGHFNSATATEATRFALSSTTHQLVNTGGVAVASQAVSVPYRSVNGVLSHNGDWWFASSTSDCDLYFWHPGSTSVTSHPWLSHCEALSYYPDATAPDVIWGIREGSGVKGAFNLPQSYYH